VGI
ncbi:CPXV205 protein, partial [Monkeypox virus]|jgi:hypothetical protein